MEIVSHGMHMCDNVPQVSLIGCQKDQYMVSVWHFHITELLLDWKRKRNMVVSECVGCGSTGFPFLDGLMECRD
jgi:hypothetical protein